jgi:ATP-dependent Lhr-like helicase
MTRTNRAHLDRHAFGRILEWFRDRNREPFDFGTAAWEHYLCGESGLIRAPTGIGKTHAAWMGPLAQWLGENPGTGSKPAPLKVLWLTPLRALATGCSSSPRVNCFSRAGVDLPMLSK